MWENDMIQGYGRFDNKEYTYEGQWRANQRHGKGTLAVPNNYTYTVNADNIQIHW